MRHLVVAALALAGCHREPEKHPPPAAQPAEPKPPLRDAIGDRDLRTLLAEVAASKACEMIRGQFRPLRAPDRRGVVTGVLWIRDCEITAAGTKIEFHIAGRGWQWADQVEHKAGGTFVVREYVKFEMSTTIPGALDLAYDRGTHIVSLWFSWDHVPDVKFEPFGKVAVDRKGLWSSVVGALSSVFISSPEHQAAGKAKQQGTSEFESELADGMTFNIDLCTGLSRFNLGRPPKGKMVAPDVVETRLVPVEVQPGGVMVFGPQLAGNGMSVRVDVDGGRAAVALVCADQAEAIAASFAQSQPLPQAKPLASAEIRGTGQLKIAPAKCNVAIVVRSLETAHPITLDIQRPAAEIAASTGGPVLRCK